MIAHVQDSAHLDISNGNVTKNSPVKGTKVTQPSKTATHQYIRIILLRISVENEKKTNSVCQARKQNRCLDSQISLQDNSSKMAQALDTIGDGLC